MAYNKAREEKKWRLWKEAEEKELRQLGVCEDALKRLREADWDDFKGERRFFEHFPDMGTYLDWQAADEPAANIHSVQELLDDIDNEELYQFLTTVDKLTLQIAVWKMDGYTSTEISRKSGLSVNAINLRVLRLKEKIKKLF